jgi:thiol-disulfide isomerase/thioredoxin
MTTHRTQAVAMGPSSPVPLVWARSQLARVWLAGLSGVLVVGVPAPARGQALTVSALAGASMATADVGGRLVSGSGQGPERIGPSGLAAGNSSTASLTPTQAADLIRGQQSRATVVILYGTRCPRSQAMFPGFVALSQRYAGRNVSFLAIAADGQAREVPPFLARYQASFQALHMKTCKGCGTARAMAPAGIHLSQTWNMPHVAVLDPAGRTVGEWDAATDLVAIDEAIQSTQ